ncbi:SPOR domain-containing protein [soil metagenome]
MGLLSLFKQKQEPSDSADSGEFRSRSEEDSRSARVGSKRSKTPAQSARRNSPVDPVLPEKKRARRRLIGALALVFAAVIGLPMLFDSEPKPLSDDISVQIPSKDKPLGANSGDTVKPATVTKNNVVDPDPIEEIISVPVSPKENIKGKLTKADSSMVASADPKTTPALSSSVAAKKDHVASVKTEVKPDNKPEIRSEAKTDVKPVIPVIAKVPAKVAYSANVDESGPAAGKAEVSEDAARALSILEGKAPAKGADKVASAYVVQVAALATQDKVNELQGKLKAANIKSYTQKVATTSGEKIRIRMGPFASKEEAEKARTKLSKLGLGGTLIPN